MIDHKPTDDRREPREFRYRTVDLTDPETVGLLRVWSTALANGWLHLADLARQQLEKRIRRQL